jgi:hypothetical protein
MFQKTGVRRPQSPEHAGHTLCVTLIPPLPGSPVSRIVATNRGGFHVASPKLSVGGQAAVGCFSAKMRRRYIVPARVSRAVLTFAASCLHSRVGSASHGFIKQPVDFTSIRPIMNMHSVSPRRRKNNRVVLIQAADSMSAAVCMRPINPERVSQVA